LAGQFVPESDAVKATEGSATSPDSKAAAEAFLADASSSSPGNGGFSLGTGSSKSKAGKKKEDKMG